MDHPMVLEIERTGYPYGYENDYKGTDSLGNEIYEGNDVFVLNDQYFLKETLSIDAIEVLERLGAETKTA